jgi:hypothetical protein
MDTLDLRWELTQGLSITCHHMRFFHLSSNAINLSSLSNDIDAPHNGVPGLHLILLLVMLELHCQEFQSANMMTKIYSNLTLQSFRITSSNVSTRG